VERSAGDDVVQELAANAATTQEDDRYSLHEFALDRSNILSSLVSLIKNDIRWQNEISERQGKGSRRLLPRKQLRQALTGECHNWTHKSRLTTHDWEGYWISLAAYLRTLMLSIVSRVLERLSRFSGLSSLDWAVGGLVLSEFCGLDSFKGCYQENKNEIICVTSFKSQFYFLPTTNCVILR
jgi:hypothetical protein